MIQDKGMISKINYAAYQNIARMRSTLNSYIRQATIAKSQLSTGPYRMAGIGNNVDIKA